MAATHIMKNRLFTALAIALPFVFLGMLEVALRLGGVAAHPPLFVDLEGVPGWRVQNADAARRYFRAEQALPTGLSDTFPAEKPPNSLRLVVQGASSAAGYPYYYGVAFSRMLDQAIEDALPETHVDVINTSLAAVNSYTLLDFADEIVAIRPDAVLIYAGHNEFYGALGVGSAQTVGRHPAVVNLYLKLSRFHTVRLLERGLTSALGLFRASTAETATRTTLMERMVGEQVIPLHSELYRQGIGQFEHNLSALLATYRKAGIPVFISTIASNERDQAPFVDAVDNPDAYRAAVRRAAAAGDRSALTDLIRADSLGASAWFARGHLPLDMSDLVAARDRDALRFRASTDINRIIHRAASPPAVVVVEGETALRNAAPDSAIGRTLMLEHLHPNPRGYFVLARAFMDALVEADLVPPVDAAAWEANLAVTPLDVRYGELRLQQLLGAWPFQPPGVNTFRDTLQARSLVDTLALAVFRRESSWQQATDQLRRHYRQTGQTDAAIRAGRALAMQFPFLPGPAAELGATHADRGDANSGAARLEDARTALHWYHRALALEETAQLQTAIGSAHMDLSQTAEAEAAFLRALVLDQSHEDALIRLVALYAATGRPDLALSTLRSHIDRYPDHARSRAILQRVSQFHSTYLQKY